MSMHYEVTTCIINMARLVKAGAMPNKEAMEAAGQLGQALLRFHVASAEEAPADVKFELPSVATEASHDNRG